MKFFTRLFIVSAFFLALSLMSYSQTGISINTDGTDANSSAMLDVKSTTGGLLVPRMTLAQRDAIVSPATSLLIYQTDGTTGFYYYSSSAWVKLTSEPQKFATVAEAELFLGTGNNLCYVVENDTYYRFEVAGAVYTDDNTYILSTANGGDTRWVGVAGKFNNNDFALAQIVHLDATSGSASITSLNTIYYIAAGAGVTTITIPDAATDNKGWFLRVYKESGVGVINMKTVSDQNIDGGAVAKILHFGQGFFIKSDNASEWLKIQDSRSDEPVVATVTSDYGLTDNWNFDYMQANTSSNDIKITLPADISGFREGAKRFIFNTGTGAVSIRPNGNLINGSSDIRIIAPEGYLEMAKINGVVKIIREKNIAVEKVATDISNLECWLDASQLTGADGSLLASWTDIENSHVFSGLAGEQPTLQTNEQNGRNTVRFDGANDVLNAGDLELTNNTRGFTMLAVVKPDNTNRMPIISKYSTVGDNRQYAFGNKDNFLFEDLNWGSRSAEYVSMKTSEYQIVEVVWTPGQAFEYYINGVLVGTGNLIINDIADGNANFKLGGSDYVYAGNWAGDFAEIMIYSEAVSEANRTSLRNTLSVKWNIDDIIIANGGGNYWQHDPDTHTILPEEANANLDMGTGTVSGGTLNASELLNAPALSSAPSSPQAGSIYFDTTDSKLKVWTGAAWVNLH